MYIYIYILNDFCLFKEMVKKLFDKLLKDNLEVLSNGLKGLWEKLPKGGAAAGGGMSQKGVNKYKKDNPGSKLKTAVTKCDVKVGTAAYKRQKAFCARSKSWSSERGKAAKRRWCCSRHS